MDPFEKKRLLPIEVMIALAINIVVAILGYYAIMMWGLFKGCGKLLHALVGPVLGYASCEHRGPVCRCHPHPARRSRRVNPSRAGSSPDLAASHRFGCGSG